MHTDRSADPSTGAEDGVLEGLVVLAALAALLAAAVGVVARADVNVQKALHSRNRSHSKIGPQDVVQDARVLVVEVAVAVVLVV